MPQFIPGELKTAQVGITVNPAGLSCMAEMYLVQDSIPKTEVVSVPFTSTGAGKTISIPLVMPEVEGEYQVWLDILAEGTPFAFYRGVEGVTLLAPIPEFSYVSGMRKELWRYTGPGDGDFVRCSVDIKNVGSVAGVCSISGQGRVNIYGCGWSGWNPFQFYDLQSATLQPGETATFGGSIVKYTIPQLLGEQHMIRSPAGIILNPATPGLYLCRICYDLYGTNVYFDTQAQLDTHILSAHPQYLPMSPLTYFTLEGLSWPDHFTMYGEDYGKITHWYAVVSLNMEDCPPGEGWPSYAYVAPDDGEVYHSTAESCAFTMPSGWVSAIHDGGGVIPNSAVLRFYFQTDQGWNGFLGDRTALRIPNGAAITFSVSSGGLSGLEVT